ncbi:MAG TPA: alpha/beta fold hydrolase [bacterium]|nr:alpha/beta fold hydrolase [bacterium]
MKRMPALLFVFVLVAFGACSGEEGPGESDLTVGNAGLEGADSPPPPAVLGGSVIQKVTSDGVAVTLEYLGVEGSPPRGGVVLVHMLGRTRADWGPLVETLISKGLDVVALDLRGHGQSARGALDYKNFETEEWLGCANDVRAALDYLAEQVSGKYFLIGASIGANLVLIEAADDSRVAGVVMLSPGSDYRGVKPGAYATDYGRRPALLVAAGDDSYSEKSVAALAELLFAPELVVYPTGGHGTHLFGSRPEVRALIADWLERQFSE